LDIPKMHLPINVKSTNNISNWQMEFNSAFKGLKLELSLQIQAAGPINSKLNHIQITSSGDDTF
jgi:hypothetical protein